MILKNLKIYFLAFAVSLTAFSCDEVGEINIGETSVVEMSGDWYIQRYTKGNDPSGDYHLMTTHNTAANDGKEMWLDDLKNDYWYKVKVPVNLSDLTFSGTGLASSVPDGAGTYDIVVEISNGKITKGDTQTSGGNTSDGISYDVEFSDDPGNIYTVSGYKRTGFPEDKH